MRKHILFILLLFVVQLSAKNVDHYKEIISLKNFYTSGEYYKNLKKSSLEKEKGKFLDRLFVKAKEIAEDNSLDEIEKLYLVTFAKHEGLETPFLNGYRLELEEKEKHCAVAKNILDDLAKNVKQWQKNNSNLKSDIFRLLGDLYIFKARHCQNDFFSRIFLFKKSKESFKKALDLDSKNMAANTSFGIYKYNAPKIGGGDVDEAIRLFRLVIKEGTEAQRFYGYCWLSLSLLKKNDNKDEALSVLSKARKINPENRALDYFEREINPENKKLNFFE